MSLLPIPPSLLPRLSALFTTLLIRLTAPLYLLNRPLSFLKALSSLPTLSVFALPLFSSYTTSLNLLFFHLTYSTLVLTTPPLALEVWGTLLVRAVFYALPGVLLWAFDVGAKRWSRDVKAEGQKGLPVALDAAGGEDRNGGAEGGGGGDDDMGRWWKVPLWSLANVLLGVGLQAGIEWFVTEELGFRGAVRVSARLPMPLGVLKGLTMGFLGREVLLYVFHRYILHTSTSPISKWHMTWQHSIPVPYSLVAHYDHPVSYLVHVVLPTYIPAMIFRMHVLTWFVYLALVSMEEVISYCGYKILPASVLLGGLARRTERHFKRQGEGDWGSWGWMDWCLGTGPGTEDRAEDDGDERDELANEEERIEEERMEEEIREVVRRVRKANAAKGRGKGRGGRARKVTARE